MKWHIKKFLELSVDELYEILKVRTDVFVVEQACPYPELDDKDQTAMHLYLEDKGEILAYLRILPKGSAFAGVGLGRVLVLERARGQGYARQLLERAIDFVADEWKEKTIKIAAQYYLRDFYDSLGFQWVSEPFLEDGIKHIEMVLELKNKRFEKTFQY